MILYDPTIPKLILRKWRIEIITHFFNVTSFMRNPKNFCNLTFLSFLSGGTSIHPRKFVPGHRKSRSDGGSLFWACTGNGSSSEALPSTGWHEEKSRTHLVRLEISLLFIPNSHKYLLILSYKKKIVTN